MVDALLEAASESRYMLEVLLGILDVLKVTVVYCILNIVQLVDLMSIDAVRLESFGTIAHFLIFPCRLST